MKNPFKQQDHTSLWIAATITGTLTAGAGIWFYLRRKRSANAEAYRHEHAQDYLADRHPIAKKHKTDVSELADIVHHQQA